MQYTETLYNSLKSYYNLLKRVGYYSGNPSKFSIFVFLNHHIQDIKEYFNKEDIDNINKMTQLFKDCLFKVNYLK